MLEEKKKKLTQQLSGSKTSAAVGKISEQQRQRLNELKQHMAELQKKLKEQTRIGNFKEQTDKQLKSLTEQIVRMKQQRVQLMKQIKEESENFRKWKMEQDKKLMQLKAEDRKRDVREYNSLLLCLLFVYCVAVYPELTSTLL